VLGLVPVQGGARTVSVYCRDEPGAVPGASGTELGCPAQRAEPAGASAALAIVLAARADGPARTGIDQGTQMADRPFVRLNVLAVQNAAALRYQTWYVRVPPLGGRPPRTETEGSPAAGY
jgi:hypothetical protein